MKTIFEIVHGEIHVTHADVIVNDANSTLAPGGNVDKAIREAAGPFAIAAQTKTILEQLGRKLEAGECAHTDSFGMTNCKGIIHAVAPNVKRGRKGQTRMAELRLRMAYINSLQKAEALEYKSIAFPMIGTGMYGYIMDDAFAVALQAVLCYLEVNRNTKIENIQFRIISERYFKRCLKLLGNDAIIDFARVHPSDLRDCVEKKHYLRLKDKMEPMKLPLFDDKIKVATFVNKWTSENEKSLYREFVAAMVPNRNVTSSAQRHVDNMVEEGLRQIHRNEDRQAQRLFETRATKQRCNPYNSAGMKVLNEERIEIRCNVPACPSFDVPDFQVETAVKVAHRGPSSRNVLEGLLEEVGRDPILGPACMEICANPNMDDLGNVDEANNNSDCDDVPSITTSMGNLTVRRDSTDLADVIYRNLLREEQSSESNSAMSKEMNLDEIHQPPSARMETERAKPNSLKRPRCPSLDDDSGFVSMDQSNFNLRNVRERTGSLRLYKFMLECLCDPRSHQMLIVWNGIGPFEVTIYFKGFYNLWRQQKGVDRTEKEDHLHRTLRKYREVEWKADTERTGTTVEDTWDCVLEKTAEQFSYRFNPEVVMWYFGCSEEKALEQVERYRAEYSEDCNILFEVVWMRFRRTKAEIEQDKAEEAAQLAAAQLQ